MIEIICSKSGLKFEAPNKRRKVHPEISWYTNHKDMDLRYKAIAVIERGKSEGWSTLEKFEEEIQKALNPEPQPRPDYDFEGDWVARITGNHSKYRFDREFLDAVDSEGRFKRYAIKCCENGIYETCYKSGKGNETRRYYRLEGGLLSEIQLEEVEAIFPKEVAEEVALEDCIVTEGYLGETGGFVELEGQVYTIVWIETYSKTVSEWDDFEDEWRTRKEPVSKNWLRLAEPEQAEQFLSEVRSQAEAAEALKNATRRLKEIAKKVTVSEGAISPKSAAYPNGRQFVLRQGYFQANELLVLEESTDRLWRLLYNNRDGDDWSYNNVEGYIGCYLEIQPELKAEVESLLDQVSTSGSNKNSS
jgi:hypothetical protein